MQAYPLLKEMINKINDMESSQVMSVNGEAGNIEIGGRNVLKFTQDMKLSNTSFDTTSSGITSVVIPSSIMADTGEGIRINFTDNKQDIMFPVAYHGVIENDVTYTISFNYRGNIVEFGQIYFNQLESPNIEIKPSIILEQSETEWKHCIVQVKHAEANIRTCFAVSLFYGGQRNSGDWIEIQKNSLKMEKGNISTDWTPAPEDKVSKSGDTMTGNLSIVPEGNATLQVGHDLQLRTDNEGGNVRITPPDGNTAGVKLWEMDAYNGNFRIYANKDGSNPTPLILTPTGGTFLGNAATATQLANGKTFSLTGDATGTSAAFNGSADASIPVTLATVNSSTGSFGPAGAASPGYGGSFNVPQITVDGKGRTTSVVNRAITMPAAPTPGDMGALPLTGGTMTGNITMQRTTPTILLSNTGGSVDKQMRCYISGDGYSGLYDVTNSKWIVYSNPTGGVTLNGNANTATKLGTATIGGAGTPIYLNGGAPTACTPASILSNIGAASAWKVLWTNSSPTSNFAAQTLTIADLKNYNLFCIGCVYSTSDQRYNTTMIYTPTTAAYKMHIQFNWYYTAGWASLAWRVATITRSENTVNIEAAAITAGSSGNTNNLTNYAIPTYILGAAI